MAKDKSTKIASKKHLARLERERRQTRLITSIAIGVVVVIVGLIGYGILNETVLKARQPVVTVNGDSVNMREFQMRVRLARQQFVDQYMQYNNQYTQYYQFAQMLGIDPTTDPSMSQAMNQIKSQMDQIKTLLDSSSQVGQQVVEDITNDLLIRQYAKSSGIVITDADLEQAVYEAFGFYPDGTPTPGPTSTTITFPTWSATQNALMTVTSAITPSPSKTPAPTQTLDLTATATAIPSLTPSSTPYTLDGFQGRYKEGLSYYAKLGLTETDFRKILFEIQIYRKRISDVVTTNVPHEQEQVWARHILVSDKATAQIFREQLLVGTDFASLAAQYSLDTGSKDNGGDLGWFGKGKMIPEFETAAFALQVGEISQPVQTTSGWHIIQVLGHETRPLTETEYTTAVTAEFNQWLTDQRTGATIVISNTWTANIPVLPSLESAFADLNATATAIANQGPPQPTPTP